MLWSRLRAVGAGVLLTVLVACGSSGPSTGPEEVVTSTSAASGSPAPDGAEWSADGASFGVDRTSWPEDVAAARDVLAALPEDLAGEARELAPPEPDEAASDFVGVTYGRRLTVLVADETLTGGPGPGDGAGGAQSTLAALFAVAYVCDPATYAGTIEQHEDYPVPGYTTVDAGTPAWFSCRIAVAEGEEEEGFSAHAVGWTTTTTAWLTVGPDEAAVRQVVTALHQAKG